MCVAASVSERVELTGVTSYVFTGGKFRLECNPVGFHLQPTDTTRWFHDSKLVVDTKIYSIRGDNGRILVGDYQQAGRFDCEQDGKRSNKFEVTLLTGICLENLSMLFN